MFEKKKNNSAPTSGYTDAMTSTRPPRPPRPKKNNKKQDVKIIIKNCRGELCERIKIKPPINR